MVKTALDTGLDYATARANSEKIDVAKSVTKNMVSNVLPGLGEAKSVSKTLKVAKTINTAKAASKQAKSVKSIAKATKGMSKTINGNSKASTKPQHGYEISEKATGDVDKTGISGQPLNKRGTSPRANQQVNIWNKKSGFKKYGSNVVRPKISNRQNALKWESKNAQRLWD